MDTMYERYVAFQGLHVAKPFIADSVFRCSAAPQHTAGTDSQALVTLLFAVIGYLKEAT